MAIRAKRRGRSTEGFRWGLCCQFLDEPIKFRTATHRYVSGLDAEARQAYLLGIARDNATALGEAVRACGRLGIGAFRINSQLLPLATHPDSRYGLATLDPGGETTSLFRAAGAEAAALGVRLSFHPDQFVVLNSTRAEVVDSAVGELEHQAGLAELVGADVLVLHGGSMTGGAPEALARLAAGIARLSDRARTRLALENDDRSFTPETLLPLCERMRVPLVYDVHHHRCLPDGLDAAAATARAALTWGEREPWVHISTPRDGWEAPNPRPHADYISADDFPDAWYGRRMTIDVEAKAKERAVVALMREVAGGAAAAEAVAPGARSRDGGRSRRR